MPYVRNKSISVTITRKSGGNGYDFNLNENKGKGPVQRIKFQNKKHPGLMVYFNIRDPDNTGLTFQPVPANALWVKAPTGPGAPPPSCPTAASKWDQFVPLSVEQAGTQLIAYFRNLDNDVHFRFALRFLDTNGTPVDYDPIGDGANGLRS